MGSQSQTGGSGLFNTPSLDEDEELAVAVVVEPPLEVEAVPPVVTTEVEIEEEECIEEEEGGEDVVTVPLTAPSPLCHHVRNVEWVVVCCVSTSVCVCACVCVFALCVRLLIHNKFTKQMDGQRENRTRNRLFFFQPL